MLGLGYNTLERTKVSFWVRHQKHVGKRDVDVHMLLTSVAAHSTIYGCCCGYYCPLSIDSDPPPLSTSNSHRPSKCENKKNHAHSIQKLIWVAPNLSAIKSTHRWPRGFRSSSELGVTFDFDRRFHMYPRRRARRPVHVGNGLLDITRRSGIVKSRGHVSRCRSRPVTC
jgi:hypothetical protein